MEVLHRLVPRIFPLSFAVGADELQEVSWEVERTGQGLLLSLGCDRVREPLGLRALEGEGEVDFSSWLEGEEEAGTFTRFLQFHVWQEGVEEEGCVLRDGWLEQVVVVAFSFKWRVEGEEVAWLGEVFWQVLYLPPWIHHGFVVWEEGEVAVFFYGE